MYRPVFAGKRSSSISSSRRGDGDTVELRKDIVMRLDGNLYTGHVERTFDAF